MPASFAPPRIGFPRSTWMTITKPTASCPHMRLTWTGFRSLQVRRRPTIWSLGSAVTIHGQLLKNRVSDNVGGVKQFSSTRRRALEEERHFALVEGFAFSNPGSLVIKVRSELGPTHASLRSLTAIMITTSNSSVKRSGTPNQLLGALLHTIAISGLSHVRTELAPLLIVPSLAHHPVQTNRQFPSHRYLGGFPPAPHHQVDVLAAPLGQTAYCHLRRFHQQKAQYRTALLGDVSQSSTIAARVFQRYQTEIAGNLFPTLKALRFADDQHEGQCGQSTDTELQGNLNPACSGKYKKRLEARVGIEPTYKGFADLSLTTWVPRRMV
jgi:hypothetical protein